MESHNIPMVNQWFQSGSSHHPVMTTIRPVVDEPPIFPLPRYQLISLKFMVAPSATCQDRSHGVSNEPRIPRTWHWKKVTSEMNESEENDGIIRIILEGISCLNMFKYV